MWTIFIGGLLLLSGICDGDSDSENQDLLQEILDSLRNQENQDYSSTPSTTLDPLLADNMTSQNNSSTTIDNATVITRTNNESIAQITSSENETSTPVPPSKPDENDAFLDPSQATTSMTPSSEYSLSNDDVTSTHGNATFTTISKQDCTTSYNILQSLCTEDLPSLVKIANIWDIYYVMFSDDVINELLLNCASGEWCIQDEFDIFRAKMAEKADMVTRSAVFAETCQELSLECLDTAAQKFESCSFGKRLNFTLEAVRLMCAIRDMTSSNQQCTAQVLSSLHVTIMDILRKENEKQDLNTAFDNEVCRTTQGLMTKTYLCTSSRCPTDIKDVLGSFKPWSWFLDDINELKATCQLGNDTCTSRDMVFIIDEAAPTAITTTSVSQTDETQQFNEDSGLVDIRSSPIALAGIGTATFIMLAGMIIFFLFFVRRHRVTSKNHEYKPLETSEP